MGFILVSGQRVYLYVEHSLATGQLDSEASGNSMKSVSYLVSCRQQGRQGRLGSAIKEEDFLCR